MTSFKQLTASNWNEPDPTSTQFAWWSEPLQAPRKMSGQDWARAFLAVELREEVPEEVRDLFAVARGASLYGWFYYPLFQLGIEQIFRVLEAAVGIRCRQLDESMNQPRFEEAIRLLIEHEVITAEDEVRWTAARHLRNRASHPSQAVVMPPGEILRLLQGAAVDINRLFA